MAHPHGIVGNCDMSKGGSWPRRDSPSARLAEPWQASFPVWKTLVGQRGCPTFGWKSAPSPQKSPKSPQNPQKSCFIKLWVWRSKARAMEYPHVIVGKCDLSFNKESRRVWGSHWWCVSYNITPFVPIYMCVYISICVQMCIAYIWSPLAVWLHSACIFMCRCV